MAPPLLKRLSDTLVAREGPLTRELVRRPGAFGLGQVPARLAPDTTTTMVCGFCSTGCGLEVHLREGQAVNLSPDKRYPVNRGMACPKGWEALAPLAASDRALVPRVRDGRGRLAPTTWEAALGTMVERIKAIQREHGPASVAFLGTGQMVTEEIALFGALCKFGMGMVHGDANTRQCMATSVVAYKEAFGFDAPPYSYVDLEESDVLVLVGSNMCIAHPILWERVLRNRHNPTIVVVDPRRTETATAATHHIALAPKSDLVLFYTLANVLFERGHVDHAFLDAHTQGAAAFREHVRPFTVERASAATGLEPARILELADLIHRGKRVSFWWTMGVNQGHEAVRTAQAIVNLALITGNIGRPGTGANSITGQCNAMGSRLFSNTTNLLGGHGFADPAARQKVASVLGIDEAVIPREVGVPYDQILEKVRKGEIRALWVAGTNPAHSWINQGFFHDICKQLDLLVVQDMYASTETAQHADILLPAAGWGEKEGTFINSERRIGLVKKVARAPGEALADFHIFKLVAEAYGCQDAVRAFASPEATFDVLRTLSAGQPCDFSGVTGWEMLDREGGIQWPCRPAESPPARERRLFEDGRFFHADGKARLVFEAPRPVAEPTDRRYPLVLLSGRGSSASWHTGTRTKKSEVLARLGAQEPYVEISPTDARRRGIRPDEWVVVTSRRAEVRARAFVTYNVQPGQVFMPMHDDVTNKLTFPSFDPYSRQPSYKHCAVEVHRAEPA